MSSVTPSDNYRDYSSRLSELEEELRQAASRNRGKVKEEVETLQATHDRELRRQADEYERTLSRSKAESQSTFSRERDIQKLAEDARKRELYDRNGKTRTAELESNQRDLESVREDVIRQTQAQKALSSNEQDRYENKIADLETSHQRDLEHAVREAHDQASLESSDTAKAGRESDVELKAALEKRYEGLNHDLMEQLRDSNHRTQAYYDELKGNYALRAEEDHKVDSAKRDETRKGYMDQQEDAAKRMRDSHAEETRGYRSQVNELGQFKRDYMRDKSNGRAEGVREVENGYRDQAKVADELYRREIDGMKGKLKEQDQYFGRLKDSTLREKDRYFAGIIGAQNEESHQAQRETEVAYGKNLKDLELRNHMDRARSQEVLERQNAQLTESRSEALEKQALTYRGEIERERTSTDAQLQHFKSELQTRDTGDDVGLIPAGAEKRLRGQVASDFQKTFAAQAGRDNERFDRTQHENKQLVHEVLDTAEKEKFLAERQHNSERQGERNSLLQHLADTETMKESVLRDQENHHGKQTERLEKSYASSLDQQRRNSDETNRTLKTDADAHLQAVRQELEFNSKTAQRAFSQRQNDIIRGYEKKLADQKTDYDSLLSETKADADLKLRESDRRNKIALDEQTRGSDQKLAQLEQQQKERERLVSSNYEEEMEKVKRSNALLIRKKS